MTELQKRFKDMVIMFISAEKDLSEEIIDRRIKEISGLPSFSALSQEDIDEISATVKAEFSIKLDKGVLIQEKGHEKWFLNAKSSFTMQYWERYKKYLLSDKGFSTNVVNTMEDVLNTLVDLLGDPRSTSYNRRGLIIGDVQSGKTANYTGLICMAADAGYKVIVLLTGTIERLRQQTQQRIDEGFVGSSSDAMMKQKNDQIIIGAGKYDSSIRPMVLTSTVDDFKQKNANNLNFDLRNINGPVIFVIKKNVGVLKRLNKWLKKQNVAEKIDHSLLLVDDEADNASVNTKADTEETPTAINGQIRELLSLFVKSSYVGFTATPFANIFIDPDRVEDLFPKDYVYSLNSPTNYTGARDIFEENGKAHHMLVRINDDVQDLESIVNILPLKHKSTVHITKLPEDMKVAIRAFLIANTIEDLRGMHDNHRSMLVNVSRFTDVQDEVTMLVNSYLKDLQMAIRNYCSLQPVLALQSEYIADLKETYETIYEMDISWEKIQRQLHNSCAGIITQAFNQHAGQNINYDDYKNGLRIIAVGGMSLSRGLTLEGLVISYFYRNSRMYDTLMQMGRWFGYRGLYSDLCRIWMSDDSIEWYRHISQATDELRQEVKRYEDSGLTPMDFGLRVRSDLNTLLVTAVNKMRSTESKVCMISMSSECIETPEIYADETINRKNYAAVEELVQKLNAEKIIVSDEGSRSKHFVFHDVPSGRILDFIEKLEISPKNAEFNTESIIQFLRDYKGKELRLWDISFATGDSETSIDFGSGIKFNPPTRSFSLVNDGKIYKMNGTKRRLGRISDGQYGLTESDRERVKELANGKPKQNDYFKGIKRKPLLTIYIVELKDLIRKNDIDGSAVYEKDTENPYKGKKVIGFGIGIPMLSDVETKYARYILNKIAAQQMFEGEFEEDDLEDE